MDISNFGVSGDEVAVASDKIAMLAAFVALGMALVLIILSIQRRSLAWVPLYGALIVLHPTWTMPVNRGDLGAARAFLAIAVSATMLGIMLFRIFWPRLSSRNFLFGTSLIFWIAYMVNWPLDSILSQYGLIPDPYSGFGAHAAFAFLAAEKDLLVVALVSSLAWLVQVWASSIRHPRAVQSGITSGDSATNTSYRNERRSDAQLTFTARITLSALSCVLLILVVLGVFFDVLEWGANPLFNIFALAWGIFLLVVAVKGRFWGVGARR